MRLGTLVDERSAERFGFPWLVEALAPLSPYGARRFAELRPFRLGDEVRAQERAARLAAAAAAIDETRVAAARAILISVPDVASAVARAAIGGVLDDPDLLELLRFCDALAELDRVVAETAPLPALANDATRAVGAALEPGRGDRNAFYLDDAFDPDLAVARERYRRESVELETMRHRARAAAARALEREEIGGDEFIVMRANLRATLPEGVRVVREAPTYLLCAMEYGDDVLAALESFQSASAEVAKLEERVRANLSTMIRAEAEGLNEAIGAIAERDVTLAAVHFAQRHHCTAPKIVAEAVLEMENARFLPLEEELERAGRSFVPLSIRLEFAAVITGPNMGGKSVTMQTCGALALLAAFGFPVPAQQARIGLFDEVAWLGVGLRERPEPLLSSFAGELMGLRGVLDRKTRRLAIFVDEFARTTTPSEGRALAIALLERLRDRGACGLAATHLPGIAEAAGAPHFAVREYAIREVQGDEPVGGDAIALAESLGFDAEFIAAAYRALAQ